MKIPRLLPYIFLCVLCSFFIAGPLFAEGSCAIKSGMSKELSTYMQTAEKLRSQIEEQTLKNQCGTTKAGENSASATAEKTQSAIIGSINEHIGFSNFFTSGRFYVGLALKSEIPTGITRDHEQLGKEMERIRDTMELVYTRCAEGVVPTTNLSDDSVYSTSEKSLGIITKDMLQNHVDMMNFYRQTVLGDRTTDRRFILVGDSQEFVSKFQGDYGPGAFRTCNGESDLFKSTRESFGRITSLGGGIEKGIDEWTRAAALMKGGSSNAEYAETERNVLREELSKQGMSTKGSQATLKCLEQYNNTGNRCNIVGGLTDIVTNMNENIREITDQFEETYRTIKAKLSKPQTTDQYMDTVNTVETLKFAINNDIIADYTNAKNLL